MQKITGRNAGKYGKYTPYCTAVINKRRLFCIECQNARKCKNNG
jgi:hypothetical protein